MNEHITKHKIKVTKTAEIITHGQLNESTKDVWIVLHGYGQLPEFFIKSFIGLSNSFIIAPSGLSKAYLTGFNGRVGANWMTSHEREDDINDYVSYLNQAVAHFKLNTKENIVINVLGFSQGVATASRYVNQTSIAINQLILWGGLVPDELKTSKNFFQNDITIVYGAKDEFILPRKEEFLKELQILKGTGIKTLEYDGTHKIENHTFLDLHKKYWS